jgi:hypothetical protein
MLFIIIGIYLVRIVSEGSSRVLTNKTVDEIRALPTQGAQVVNITKAQPDAAATPGPDRFDVEINVPISDSGSRLAQQLLTTVGTLVVAVAAFYFGTSATAAGASAALAAVSGTGARGGPTTAPAITGLSRPSGPPGASVTVRGSGFGAAKGLVAFGQTPAADADIQSWADTAITVKVPAGMSPGKVPVAVTLAGATAPIPGAQPVFEVT